MCFVHEWLDLIVVCVRVYVWLLGVFRFDNSVHVCHMCVLLSGTCVTFCVHWSEYIFRCECSVLKFIHSGVQYVPVKKYRKEEYGASAPTIYETCTCSLSDVRIQNVFSTIFPFEWVMFITQCVSIVWFLCVCVSADSFVHCSFVRNSPCTNVHSFYSWIELMKRISMWHDDTSMSLWDSASNK